MRFLYLVLIAVILTACGGGGGSKTIEPAADDSSNNQQASKNPPADENKKKDVLYTISGVISINSGITMDDDINDATTIYCSYRRQVGDADCNNDSPLQPQRLPKLTTVIGFASAQGTGTNIDRQRFQSKADKDDYYRIHLDAGSSLYLQVLDQAADNSNVKADLDLFATRYDGNNLSNVVYSSNQRGDDGSIEHLTVADAGDYLIHVQAFQGISKYILKIQPANTADNLKAPAQFVSGEMIVQTIPETFNSGHRSLYKEFSIQYKNRPQLVTLADSPQLRSFANTHQAADIAEYLKKIETLQSIKRLQLSGEVEFAEPNYIRHLTAVTNDQYHHLQWSHNNIDLPQAWNITKGDKLESHFQDVIVAVIDSGVYLSHEDLKTKWVPGYDFISSNITSRDGDGIDRNPDDPGSSDDPNKSSWHGTHVAGIIAAASNNSIGIAGVSWGAKIMPLRVLGKNGGTSYDLSQAVRFAAGLPNDSGTIPSQRADILNLSLGSQATSESERLAIREAIEAGILVVAAAGNDNTGINNYPAAYPDVIAVSATRKDNLRADYSNYGGYIRAAAPGGEISDAYDDRGIVSTFVEGHVDNYGIDTRKSTYAAAVGTSMATPHVAGVLALMKSVNPALTQYDILNLLSNCEITSKKGNCAHDIEYGYGLINANLAVEAARSSYSGSQSALIIPSVPRLSLHSLNSNIAHKIMTLTNYGRLKATNLRISSNADWLSAVSSPINTDVVDVNGVLRVTVSTNSNDLAAGRHEAELTVKYASGNEQKTVVIGVSLQVGVDTQISTLVNPYVLLEKENCQESCIVAVVEPIPDIKYGAPYAEFKFSNVPAGEYRIFASSDIDKNYQVFEYGEMVGVYPVGERGLHVDRDITGAHITLSLFEKEAQPSNTKKQTLSIKPFIKATHL